MGWSGEGIMNGDTPMDYEHDLRDICGNGWESVPGGADDLPEFTAAVLAEHEDAIATYCEKSDDSIAFEVWGQMLVDASASVRSDRRIEIHRRITLDIMDLPNQNWSDEVNRRFCLRELRDAVEVLGTGNVVDINTLRLDRMAERVTEAMQGAFEGIEDPSVAQRAVARFIEDLTNGDTLDDWGYAAQAVVNVGLALVEARSSGIDIDDAVNRARPLIGA